MNNKNVVRSLLCGLAIIPAAAFAQTVPLTQDSFVDAGTNVNYGTDTKVGVGGANSRSALAQFDLTALPSGTTGSNVVKATLTLFVNAVSIMPGR